MSSYTNIFGGSPVQPSEVSYLALELNADTTLSWPTQFQDTNNVVSHIIDVTPDAGGWILTLPNAQDVSVGQDILINNPSADGFTLNKNDGTLLSVVDAGNIIYFYLIDNTTNAGDWRAIPFGGGVAAVTSVNADVPDATDAQNLHIVGGPITAAGTFHFSFDGDLNQLIGFGGNTGIAARIGVEDWALRAIQPVANGNVIVNNGNGVAGNITLDLSPNIGIPPNNPVNTMQVGNILLGTNIIASANLNGNINLQPNGTGLINLANNTNIQNGSILKFFNAGNTQYNSFSGSAVAVTSVDFTWPVAPPVAGQVLQVSAVAGVNPIAATLFWANVTTFFGGASTDTAIARFHGTSGQIQNSGILIDGGNNLATPASLSAGVSLNVGTLSLGPTNIVSTSAGNITISPVSGASTGVSSDLFIGTTAVGGSKSLFFQYLGFTVSLVTPVLAGSIALTLPSALPANDNSIFQSSSAGALSFSPLFLPGAAPGANNVIMQGATTGALTFSALTTVIAAKADMETPVSTTNPVIPANVQYHPGVNKAWVTFAGASAALDQNYNIAGVTRNSAGNYTVTFATPFAATTYSFQVSCAGGGAALNLAFCTGRATNTATIECFTTLGVATDPAFVSFSALGAQ